MYSWFAHIQYITIGFDSFHPKTCQAQSNGPTHVHVHVDCTSIYYTCIGIQYMYYYIELSRKEGLLHDAASLFELAYDVANYLGEKEFA